MARDDFSNWTKEQLARRVGYRCSYPECGAPAFGPSEEGSDKTTNIGTACHIAAASGGPGARRYVATMTPAQRSDIDNGIWMCRNHGKLIDDDETRFSIAVLKKWKEIAEYVAKIIVEKNCDYEEAIKRAKFVDLAPETLEIDLDGKENEIIGNFTNDCCVSIAWGKSTALKVRDFIIEHIRNAFQHGKATEIKVSAADNKITITDNGKAFNPKSLLNTNYLSGGTLSVKEVYKEINSKIIFTTQRLNESNYVTLGKIVSENDVLNITPCSHKISFEEFRNGDIKLNIHESCNEIFVVLPNYISPSDIGLLTKGLFNLKGVSKPVTLITRHLSDLVSHLIKEHNPEVQIVEVG